MAKIWTIGHSNKQAAQLAEILKTNKITFVADARTIPFSRANPQFNRDDLRAFLLQHGIEYHSLGKSIGGLRKNVHQEETIENLTYKAEHGVRLVLLCSESWYQDCHRFSMLTPLFEARGIEVEHLVWD